MSFVLYTSNVAIPLTNFATGCVVLPTLICGLMVAAIVLLPSELLPVIVNPSVAAAPVKLLSFVLLDLIVTSYVSAS